MMRRLSILLMFLSVGLVGAAAAHDGHSHGSHKMTGTVKAVHPDRNHVEITAKDGKTQGFHVSADTRYLKGSTKLALSDLTPGTRVVVDAKMDGAKMVATTVRVGGATKTGNRTSTQPQR